MNDQPRSGSDRTRCGPVDQIISLHSLSCSSSGATVAAHLENHPAAVAFLTTFKAIGVTIGRDPDEVDGVVRAELHAEAR
jgi:hypothetical protein